MRYGPSRRCSRAAIALLGVLVVLTPGHVAAQSAGATGALIGVVRDSSGSGVGSANVTVAGLDVRAVTDSAGRFRLAGLPAGARDLNVRRLGFRARTVGIAIDSGRTSTITIVLAALPRELDPILVEAARQPSARYLQGFYERRAKGHGYFITRDQIASRHWSEMTDVLRSLVPAVRITSSRMARNAVRLRANRCAPLVWLDGAPASAGEFDLDFISPETVSGVEIYPGPATVPVEFRSSRGLEACGVIVVWSRVESPEPRERRRRSSPLDSAVVTLVYTAEEVDSAARVDSTKLSQPFYPDSLYAFRIGGEVVAQFVVDTTGRVMLDTFSALSSTHAGFTEAVRRSLRSSRFHPAKLDGRPVRQVMVLPYRFVIDGAG